MKDSLCAHNFFQGVHVWGWAGALGMAQMGQLSTRPEQGQHSARWPHGCGASQVRSAVQNISV